MPMKSLFWFSQIQILVNLSYFQIDHDFRQFIGHTLIWILIILKMPHLWIHTNRRNLLNLHKICIVHHLFLLFLVFYFGTSFIICSVFTQAICCFFAQYQSSICRLSCWSNRVYPKRFIYVWIVFIQKASFFRYAVVFISPFLFWAKECWVDVRFHYLVNSSALEQMLPLEESNLVGKN